MRFLFVLSLLTVFSLPVHAAEAVFGGGCFWCMESDLEKMKGVESVVSGYSGGHVENPTYKQVSKGGTGHIEVVKVTYDPKKISYAKLLEVFWENVDPFDPDGQFCDKGDQYVAAIFVSNDEEKKLAEETKAKVEEHFGQEVATKILPSAPFYPAEDYHQDYYKENSWRYNFYRKGCGRDDRLEEVWGKKK